jgi:carbamoyltransferase
VLPEETLEAKAAELLQRGYIFGWLRAAWGIGPRALGNRSILANPTLPDKKDRVNAEVKQREAFRPFAASCPLEEAPQFFEHNVADPFMLKLSNVRPEQLAALLQSPT